MIMICKNYKICHFPNYCKHSKPHEFVTGKIGFIENCQGKSSLCNCVTHIPTLRKLKLQKLLNVTTK